MLRALSCSAVAAALLVFAGDAAAEDPPIVAERRQAHGEVERADKAPPAEAKPLYGHAAERFRALFQASCDEPSRTGDPLRSERCDEDGYNAGRAFAAAGQGAKAIAAYRSLIAFDERTTRTSPLALRAMYELGVAYESLAMFDQAADWHEKYATRDPLAVRADAALKSAILLRLGLGDTEAAVRDADRFAKSYARTKPAETAHVAIALALHHAEHERWDDARAVLSKWMPLIDLGALDLRMRAHAVFARSAMRSSKPSGPLAAHEYAKVLAMWSDPDAAAKKIAAAWPNEDEAQHMRRLAYAIDAAGEALVALADVKKKADVDAIAPGAKDFVEKRSAAIEATEAEYAKVLALRPVPPPRWTVAAKSRVAMMWASLHDDLVRARVPAAVREPILRSKARPALVACVDLAAKMQWVDASADGCAAWLASHFPKEHFRVDEIVPSLYGGAPFAWEPLRASP